MIGSAKDQKEVQLWNITEPVTFEAEIASGESRLARRRICAFEEWL